MINFSIIEKKYMLKALKLALKGKTSPNPRVGCIIVKDNLIIGHGYHKKAGMPHAEIEAINNALKNKKSLINSTMYVTLEPCSHKGKTPPCCDAIIKNKIKKVIIAIKDPNKLVNGKGIKKLKKAGIKVRLGLLEKHAEKINKTYLKHIKKGKPYVILKQATSLDGKIATETGDSKWISNKKSREIVHKIRNNVDAVMVGIGTVVKDNPRLTCRLKTEKEKYKRGNNENKQIQQPTRIIIDSKLKIPLNSKVLKDKNIIIATTKDYNKTKYNKLKNKVRELIVCKSENKKINKKENANRVDLNNLMIELGKRNIQSILIEAGSQLATSLIKDKLVDKLFLFIAPIIIGNNGIPSIYNINTKKINDSIKLKNVKIKRIDDNILIQGRF